MGNGMKKEGKGSGGTRGRRSEGVGRDGVEVRISYIVEVEAAIKMLRECIEKREGWGPEGECEVAKPGSFSRDPVFRLDPAGEGCLVADPFPVLSEPGNDSSGKLGGSELESVRKHGVKGKRRSGGGDGTRMAVGGSRASEPWGAEMGENALMPEGACCGRVRVEYIGATGAGLVWEQKGAGNGKMRERGGIRGRSEGGRPRGGRGEEGGGGGKRDAREERSTIGR